MLTEYALLKLQSVNGEEVFIHSVPALLCSKRVRESQLAPIGSSHLEVLPITNILDTTPYHALIYYKNGGFYVSALSPMLINGNPLTPSDSLLKIIHTDKTPNNAIERYIKELDGSMKDENIESKLATITRLTILSESDP